jgi:hypothetical protein
MQKPWHGLIHCPECNALHRDSRCEICGAELDLEPVHAIIDGEEMTLPPVMQGAIPWSIFVLLEQIRIESERPAEVRYNHTRLSQRFTVVLLFWTLFEVLIDGFYRAAFADLPGQLGDELLQRFPNIGGRLNRLYQRTWQLNFADDLCLEGFEEEAALIGKIQSARNAFVHGSPEAIDDELVDLTLSNLESAQRGWIAIFNKRCTRRHNKIPIWMSAERRASRT